MAKCQACNRAPASRSSYLDLDMLVAKSYRQTAQGCSVGFMISDWQLACVVCSAQVGTTDVGVACLASALQRCLMDSLRCAQTLRSRVISLPHEQTGHSSKLDNRAHPCQPPAQLGTKHSLARCSCVEPHEVMTCATRV